MSSAKLIALLLISFLATASIVYNLRGRRRPQPSVATPAAGTPSLPASSIEAPPPEPAVAVPEPEATAQKIAIPADGWGRNPFLTVSEIDRLKHPDLPVVISRPAPLQGPVEPTDLPSYPVTAIIAGVQGNMAVVGSRLVKIGDQLGSETVKEIKDRGVVLEYEGRTRELPLKKLEDIQPQPAAPKKETKE